MNKEKVSKKEIKKNVLAKIEAAMKEFKNVDNGKKFAKKMKEASSILSDFIVHHSKAASTKPAVSKVKATKKSTPKKTVKAKTAK
ncbi:MAG: hypothetical protein ABL872_02470 [Lacibacter sp.]